MDTPVAVSSIRCPVCASPVGDADVHVCPRCDTPHHRECWDYVGGCALFGCEPSKGPARPTAVVPLDDGAVTRSLDRWLWTYRAYSVCLAGCGPSLGLTLLLSLVTTAPYPLGMHEPWWLTALAAMNAIAGVAFLLCGLGVVLFGLPLLVATWRLSSLLDGAVTGPPRDSRAVLDRLDVSGLSGIILSATEWARPVLDPALVVGQASFLFLLLGSMLAPFGFFGVVPDIVFVILLILTFFGFFLAGPLVAARDRLTYLATVQNRAALSLTAGKGGTPGQDGQP